MSVNDESSTGSPQAIARGAARAGSRRTSRRVRRRLDVLAPVAPRARLAGGWLGGEHGRG